MITRADVKELARLVAACRRHARRAAAVSGKSIARQLTEIVALRLGTGKLSAEEYYYYGLYDDARFTWKAKKQFFGQAMEDKLCTVLGTRHWHALAWDKVITNVILESAGIPTARIFAIYDSSHDVDGVPCLRSREEVARFLRETDRYPLVCKPNWGISGQGVVALDAVDTVRDRLLLADGGDISVPSFVEALPVPRWKRVDQGVLFQERLSPHPLIAARCGERICSLRLIVLMADEGPRIFRAYWKIAAGKNFIDNFQRGLSGNLVATVDVRSGVATRCVGYAASGRPEPATVHPDTGRDLVGFRLPLWEATLDLTRKAANLIPGLRMQAWDVAICPDRPVFLEVNVVGGFNLPQIADDAGIYDGELRSYLEKFGFG